MRKFLSLLLIFAVLVACFVSCDIGEDSLEGKYKKALKHISNKKYEQAYEILVALEGYKDSDEYLSYFYFVPTKVFFTENDEKTERKLSFDESGRPIKILDSNEDRIVDFSYDSYGNIKVINKAQNNIYEYTYDQNGNLIKEEYTSNEGTDNSVHITNEYSYDEAGRVVEEIKDYINNRLYSSFSITRYTYDEAGEIVKKEIENKKGDISTTTYSSVDTLDDNGNIIFNSTISTTNGEISDKIVSEYIYDENGRLIIESTKHDDYISMGWYYLLQKTIETVTEYYYDRDGKLISKFSVSNRENKKISEIVVEYTYDSDGKLIKETKRREEFGGKFNEAGFEIGYAAYVENEERSYDTNENISSYFYELEGDYREYHTFDKYGNLIHLQYIHSRVDLEQQWDVSYDIMYLPDANSNDWAKISECMLEWVNGHN